MNGLQNGPGRPCPASSLFGVAHGALQVLDIGRGRCQAEPGSATEGESPAPPVHDQLRAWPERPWPARSKGEREMPDDVPGQGQDDDVQSLKAVAEDGFQMR